MLNIFDEREYFKFAQGRDDLEEHNNTNKTPCTQNK